MGTKGFFLNGVEDVSVLTLFFFMMVFFDTTATIPTGSPWRMLELEEFLPLRTLGCASLLFVRQLGLGGGFLAQAGINWGLGHGAVDFAGSGVVHAMGGVIGLAGAICLGPRIGRYINGKPQAMPGHHIPMVVFGTFILAFGWFGFNPGSTLAGTDLRLTSIVVNTMLASVTAGIAAMTFMMIRGMRPDPTMMCNGFLGGLVAITAPFAFVDSLGAAVIGAVAGVLVVLSVLFFDKLQVDDPIGALSVHGTNGIWGVISVGIFANGKYGAGWNGVERAAFKNLPGSGGIDGVAAGIRTATPLSSGAAPRRGRPRGVRIRHGLRLVQGEQFHYSSPRLEGRRTRWTRRSGHGSSCLSLLHVKCLRRRAIALPALVGGPEFR